MTASSDCQCPGVLQILWRHGLYLPLPDEHVCCLASVYDNKVDLVNYGGLLLNDVCVCVCVSYIIEQKQSKRCSRTLAMYC